ncbi:MAG: ROK family transcriptional regulator [Clostridia bacterium]|nr:ROK family transcriptional regulator [Clostridia bacterium]
MDRKVTNPKILRKSNKISILFKLLHEGDKSRLQLASELGLTTASITQISKEIMEEGLISEQGNVQRNATGRREVLLHFKEDILGAIGVNIEKDKIHIALCTYHKVIEEKIFATQELVCGNAEALADEIEKVLEACPQQISVLGVGVGITGKVDKKWGIAVDSHGILPNNYPLLDCLTHRLCCDISVSNNVRAQARALISKRDENFMYVKHSPGIGCALVVNGKVVEGYNGDAGELGHTVVRLSGKPCACGKRGCLETLASETAVEDAYFDRTGIRKDIASIYAEYRQSEAATAIINELIERLAMAIGNAATLNDPKMIMVTGGLFFQKGIVGEFYDKMKELGFKKQYKIQTIGNDKKIKAYAGARHILMEKLFEV